MCGRTVAGITDWTSQNVVIDVPNGSIDIEFGITMAGFGRGF